VLCFWARQFSEEFYATSLVISGLFDIGVNCLMYDDLKKLFSLRLRAASQIAITKRHKGIGFLS